MLTIFKCMYGSVALNISIVVQPSPPFIPRTFSSSSNETLYRFNTNFLFSFSNPWQLDYSRYLIYVESYSIYSLSLAYFAQNRIHPSLSMLQHMSEFPSFLRLSYSQLYYMPHFVYPLIMMDMWVAPTARFLFKVLLILLF